MKKLAEFDCLALMPLGETGVATIRIARVFPRAAHVSAYDTQAQIDALSEMTGAYVLLLPAYVLPQQSLGEVRPDPVLLNAGYRLGWMARNAVTAELVSFPSPQLWLRTALVAHLTAECEGPIPDAAILPMCQADWVFNTSSGAAFTAGFEYILTLKQQDIDEESRNTHETVAASFGSDAPYADWWQLGVFAAILGKTDRRAAYRHEKSRCDNDGDVPQRLEDLARKMRIERGLNTRRLSAKNSRFFKQNRFLRADKPSFEAIATQYETLGAAGKVKAQKYRAASTWIWGN